MKRGKATTPSPKSVGGRPSSYRAEYADQAQKLALLGLTDKRIADFFEVSEKTLNNWKHAHPAFLQSLKAGKDEADAHVVASLYQSAIGGGTVTEMKEEVDADGRVVHRKMVKELPANVTAQIFWLKNRQPQNWRDKVVVEDETPPETLAQTANQFIAIMSEARERQKQVLVERGLLPPDTA